MAFYTEPKWKSKELFDIYKNALNFEIVIRTLYSMIRFGKRNDFDNQMYKGEAATRRYRYIYIQGLLFILATATCVTCLCTLDLYFYSIHYTNNFAVIFHCTMIFFNCRSKQIFSTYFQTSVSDWITTITLCTLFPCRKSFIDFDRFILNATNFPVKLKICKWCEGSWPIRRFFLCRFQF